MEQIPISLSNEFDPFSSSNSQAFCSVNSLSSSEFPFPVNSQASLFSVALFVLSRFCSVSWNLWKIRVYDSRTENRGFDLKQLRLLWEGRKGEKLLGILRIRVVGFF